jgi:uncharacterized YceG family protein
MSQLGFDTKVHPRQTRGGRRRQRQHRRRGAIATAVVVAITVSLLGGAAWGARSALQGWLSGGKSAPADFSGEGRGAVTVEVRPGDSVAAIGGRLADAGVVSSPQAFVTAALADPRSTSLQPGFYQLRLTMSGAAALARMLDPASLAGSRVTLIEGSVQSAAIARLASASGIPVAEFTAALAKASTLGIPSYSGGRVEGFLHPARYDIPPKPTARALLKQVFSAYQATAKDLQLEARAKALKLTPYQVLIVASIIQAEVRLPSDMPKVARVIYNRIAAGKPLEFDTTIIYGIKALGAVEAKKFTSTVTPYNTYLKRGLPPGPIDSPGKQALSAALSPAAGNWLYFVVIDKTGKTAFADTYAQQQINEAKARAAGVAGVGP